MNQIPDDIDWRQYEEETQHSADVLPATGFIKGMIADIGRPKANSKRVYLPWGKTHKSFWFRPGEVSMWAGVNGHGKSAVTGLVAVSIVAQDEKVGIASFEMTPQRTISRQVRQFFNFADPDDEDPSRDDIRRDLYEQFDAFTTDKLWFYRQKGSVTPKRVLAVTRYCFQVLGIKHMFIDSLMKCVRDEDDYNAQKNLVNDLAALAADYGAHVHLVHHLKKLGKETDEPDKSDVLGSGSIVNLLDNLFLVYRNKGKELSRQSRTPNPLKDEEPDAALLLRKQRNGTGWEGKIALWFHEATMQYTGRGNAEMDMLSWPHKERKREEPI